SRERGTSRASRSAQAEESDRASHDPPEQEPAQRSQSLKAWHTVIGSAGAAAKARSGRSFAQSVGTLQIDQSHEGAPALGAAAGSFSAAASGAAGASLASGSAGATSADSSPCSRGSPRSIRSPAAGSASSGASSGAEPGR